MEIGMFGKLKLRLVEVSFDGRSIIIVNSRSKMLKYYF